MSSDSANTAAVSDVSLTNLANPLTSPLPPQKKRSPFSFDVSLRCQSALGTKNCCTSRKEYRCTIGAPLFYQQAYLHSSVLSRIVRERSELATCSYAENIVKNISHWRSLPWGFTAISRLRPTSNACLIQSVHYVTLRKTSGAPPR